MYNDFKLFPEVIENEFLYIGGWGASVEYENYYKKPEEIEDSLQNSALNISGVFERYNVTKYVKNLKLGDEISSGFFQDYIARGEQTRLEVINYLKEKKVPLSDLNLPSYEKI